MPDCDEDSPRKFLRLRRRWNGPGHAASTWAPPRQPVTDPKQIVQSNFDHEQRAGLYRMKPMRRRRRRRGLDFLMMCVAGNGLALGFLYWIEASLPTTLVTGSGMIFYTLALGWVMFVQHDEY